ncbi:thiamine phosphate synthase [Ralstonia solanacearum]|nr:thiamine phosphate synthase [Ralstonia solanacearum]AST35551.2 thiamine phosphate synthase [Ralstonia solanacearum]ATJ88998.1 thiamine phosphate synthase [Ralstonia solanacearum]AYB54315.1 thiamine phosphate synthase [Ralstonia solanacearum]AYB58872.1 thiamine phosphate synthase [Ralstonia solanacearum]MBB6592579.1 thiamine phosphate synthase [Ralstonia solanacearum]
MKDMSLPDFYQITPEPVGSPHFETFFAELTDTLGSGIRLLQLRAKQLGPREHLDVARRTRDLCRQSGAILMLNGPIDMAREVGCDGVHLGSDALMSLRSRPVPDTVLLSAACHSAEQLEQAARMAVDFVTLSPVLRTRTHPDADPLGWERFTELAQRARVPVFALGGMHPDMLDQAKRAGAWGVAAISATWCHRSAGA